MARIRKVLKNSRSTFNFTPELILPVYSSLDQAAAENPRWGNATSVENGPLFPNGKGGFWNEKNWRNRKFYPFLEEIGIQPNPYDENGKRKPEFAGKLATYTPYTTRHTYASLCDRAGVNKDILKRAVGHTPKSKTLDEVYLHPKATQMIEAFDKANQLVNDEVLTATKA